MATNEDLRIGFPRFILKNRDMYNLDAYEYLRDVTKLAYCNDDYMYWVFVDMNCTWFNNYVQRFNTVLNTMNITKDMCKQTLNAELNGNPNKAMIENYIFSRAKFIIIALYEEYLHLNSFVEQLNKAKHNRDERTYVYNLAMLRDAVSRNSDKCNVVSLVRQANVICLQMEHWR